jgi:dTDP-4-amino-4,6-dideoxygalactose transaminase
MDLLTENMTLLKIPFSPPYIDEDVIAEVVDTLQSGWITTGPKVKQLEILAGEFLGVKKTVCVNSWTSGAMLVLKWLGVGAGDEVIIPAYTYAATALAVIHAGAKPVMVDILSDFTIDPEKIRAAITPRTKAILTVDVGGWPCAYDEINKIVASAEVKAQFKANNKIQETFGRAVIIADAAHSLGARYAGEPAALASDVAVFSLHAVKNVTTAEGGLVCFSLPEPAFDNDEVYQWFKLHSLNGQTKDAFAKEKEGGWRYDIVTDGLKVNMPDICAAIGLAQLRKYPGQLLPARKEIYEHYTALLSKKDWAVIPPATDDKRVSSYHLFPLRIKGLTCQQRDNIIKELAAIGIATNVHFTPLPMLTYFKALGYKIEDYPVAYSNYANEISLPIYHQLTFEHCAYIVEQLEKIYFEVI